MYLFEYEDVAVKKETEEPGYYDISTYHKPQISNCPLRFNTTTKKAYIYSNTPLDVEGITLVGQSVNPRDNVIVEAEIPLLEDAPW